LGALESHGSRQSCWFLNEGLSPMSRGMNRQDESLRLMSRGMNGQDAKGAEFLY